ncbi:coiled-coil domain-containing protein 1 isoform X2 [Tribolium castaneum]|uniref:coiled-coil domain-containing protein 1 isoform X2 n=1 Tax=Tribolium castaneum TaxID=7070 RepID=UPI00046BF04F|nr:PREDICTED: acidic leucine-rich nuclear phosphoprotein 32-related protein isoform X2 [Tribolium castaneum]|eukprot:XP_008201688.1 PREDICTED: acidic leucine-rich nuclear phosphoprotein 32-related protein isoform X2 [Tribolium castaneum]
MMGAGGFIRNPGWDILSGDDLMDEDYHNDLVIDNFFDDGDDFELNSEVVLFLPAEELEADEDDYFDDTVDIDDDDDEDYVLSDSLDDEDFDDDNAIVMPSDESSPERNN